MSTQDIVADAKPQVLPAHSMRRYPLFIGAGPFVIALVLWIVVGWFDPLSLRYVIPKAGEVAAMLVGDLQSKGFWHHFTTTMIEVFAGLAIAVIAGVVIGAAIGLSRFLEEFFYPFIIFFQAIPKVALAPVWLIAFGFGAGSKIALSAMVAFFPILVGVIVGLSATQREEFELMKSLRASAWQTFWKVRVPRAIPSIFGALEVAVLFALIGAIVGEFVGAQAGLGYLIQFRSSRLDLPGVFSPLIVLSVVGLILDLGTKKLGKRLMRWEEH
jgi:NitT/TauT family transport system permease protein